MKYGTACPAKQLLAIPAAATGTTVYYKMYQNTEINRKQARKAGTCTPQLLVAKPLANINTMMFLMFLTSILFAYEFLTAFSLTKK
jgi:hypothetical protein